MQAIIYTKSVPVKRFKIDKVFHFSEAEINFMRALLLHLSLPFFFIMSAFFFSVKPNGISDMSFPYNQNG